MTPIFRAACLVLVMLAVLPAEAQLPRPPMGGPGDVPVNPPTSRGMNDFIGAWRLTWQDPTNPDCPCRGSLFIDIDANADGALASYEQQVLLALEESENAFSDYANAQQRLLSLVRQSTASRAAAQQAEIRYREGTVDYLVLLDAERERLSAEDAQAQGEVELYRGIVAIYKALGGGWQPETVASK